MQIEIEVLHLSVDFRKKELSERHGTCTHSPCYPHPLKGWQLHHSESKFWSQYLAAEQYFFFFTHWAAEIRDPTDITEFTLFPLLPVLPLLLSSKGSVWPPNTPDTLCCYFQYKISIQGLLEASQCLFSTPPTWFSLNARQIEHFRELALQWKHLSESCPMLQHLKVSAACARRPLWLVGSIFLGKRRRRFLSFWLLTTQPRINIQSSGRKE